MKDDLIISLPYPRKFFGLTISWNKKIGFLFTNLSIFLFREEAKITTSESYTNWIKANGESRLVTEMMYSAAQAYCLHYRLKQDFTKEKLMVAIASAPNETQQTIISAWRNSQTFGLIEGKKKQVTNRR